MSWTQERVELLRKLWLEGLSAAQVAAELGAGVTRNAVIGKIHRLGLAERGKPVNAPRPRAARPSRATVNEAAPRNGVGAMVMGNVALALSPRPVVATALRPDEEVVVPISLRVTLMELRETMCHWPLGDPTTPEFRFCGSRYEDGEGPYCRHHSRIAYQPHADRRKHAARAAR